MTKNLLFIALWLGAGCGQAQNARAPDVILVTLDTTRADALGAYGGPEGLTPHLDDVIGRGVRFAWGIAHAPTTLSSHTSMFSGLDPHGHRVPRNGFPIPSDVPLLAEQLAQRGYDTAAVIAASAVDSSTGIQRGFRQFDGALDVDQKRRFEAPADAVTTRALAAVAAADKTKPLFLWVHYYDAHAPFEAPARLVRRWAPEAEGRDLDARHIARRTRQHRLSPVDRRAYTGSYHAEIAWIDENFGTLLDGLSRAGRLENAYVVVVGDHGEMLFDDPSAPVGHGPDIDLPVTHVPYAITGFGVRRQTPRVVDTPVPLSSVGPTLLALATDAAGTDRPKLGDGPDLSPALRGESITVPPFFLEATKPVGTHANGGWNNARCEKGAAANGFLYIEPHPARRRPPQLFAIADAQPPVRDESQTVALRNLLRDWVAGAPPFREERMSDDQREALQALGYIEPDAPTRQDTPP